MSGLPPPGVSVCAKCGLPIAGTQRVEHRGEFYCVECVGKALDAEPPRSSPSGLYRSPTLAVMLSVLPGAGQMYCLQMARGSIILAAFLCIFALGPLAILNIIVYVWQLFDAYWCARRLNEPEIAGLHASFADDYLRKWFHVEFVPAPPLAQCCGEPSAGPSPAAPAPTEPALPGPQETTRTESAMTPVWGVVLIVLGVLFLLVNFEVLDMTWEIAWPAALLAVGIWMLISYLLSRRPPATNPSEESQDEPSPSRRTP